MTDKPLTIVRLESQNIKRIKAVEIVPSPGAPTVTISGLNDQGKQQPLSEPVLTPSGWKPIGSLVEGDKVIGSSGKPIRVTGVFPQSSRIVYKVTMADGSSTRCGPDHLWSVATWKSSGRKQRWVSSVRRTMQLISDGLWRCTGSRRYAVPVSGPVEYADSGMNLPVDPYTLGVILGDGHIELSGFVTITSVDDEILSRVLTKFSRRRVRGSVMILSSAEWSRPLVHMGLAGKLSFQKFIPDIYQTASVSDRASLLSGLMDTDGTAARNWSEYCTTSPLLAQDVRDLARGLGHVVNVNSVTKRYRYKGEHKQGRLAYIVRVKGGECPFRLGRKKLRWSRGTRSVGKRLISSIDRVEDEACVCISVDSKDGLYVTKDFILTHNSSVLDSIEYALGGAETFCERPLRDGTSKGHVIVDLGELVVKRVFTAAGDSKITVEAVESGGTIKLSSPQAVLDAFCTKISFDPLEFVRMKPNKQLETLRKLVGLDFTELDVARQKAYDDRTLARRQLDEASMKLAATLFHHGAPAEEVSIFELMEQIEAVRSKHRKISDAAAEQRRVAQDKLAISLSAEADVKNLIEEHMELKEEIVQMKDLLAKKEADAAELLLKIQTSKETHTALAYEAGVMQAKCREEFEQSKLELDALAEEEPIMQSIRSCEANNEKVRANKVHLELKAEISAKEARVEAFSRAIAGIDKTKDKRISAAKFPVPGLGFDDNSVLLNGVPFAQGSQARQLQAAVGIGLAMNPKVRVILVRDASLLDDDSKKMIADMAQANQAQVWLEEVDSDDPCAVVIEDGMVLKPE